MRDFVREFGRTFSVDVDADELTADEYSHFENLHRLGERRAHAETQDVLEAARAAKHGLPARN